MVTDDGSRNAERVEHLNHMRAARRLAEQRGVQGIPTEQDERFQIIKIVHLPRNSRGSTDRFLLALLDLVHVIEV